MKSLTNLFFLLIFLILILILPSYIYFKSHYVDLLAMCSIKLDGDFLQGNTGTLVKAISKLKIEDGAAYQDLCRYVDMISENSCPIDHVYGGPWKSNNQPGCYIKGSKIIYVSANKDDSSEIIKQRAEAIKKYSSLSKKYWNNPN